MCTDVEVERHGNVQESHFTEFRTFHWQEAVESEPNSDPDMPLGDDELREESVAFADADSEATTCPSDAAPAMGTDAEASAAGDEGACQPQAAKGVCQPQAPKGVCQPQAPKMPRKHPPLRWCSRLTRKGLCSRKALCMSGRS